jgi:imidazolonepropionase-like amidohydrolase
MQARAETVYVKAGQLVDVEAGRVLPKSCITIIDSRITAIGRCARPPEGARVVDWQRYTVMPGLIDLHTHLADVGQGADIAEPIKRDAAETAFIGARNAYDTLRAGFTSVRDVGSFRAFGDVRLRDAIEKGLIPGPRMAVVGAYITIAGGGGEINGLPAGTVPPEMRAGVSSTPAEGAAMPKPCSKAGRIS